MKTLTLNLVLGVVVHFTWQHSQPLNVSQFKLYKGSTEAAMSPVATITRTGTETSYSLDYNFEDTSPQYFGIAAVNNFGESVINTRNAEGAPILLGKPLPVTMFSFSVAP